MSEIGSPGPGSKEHDFADVFETAPCGYLILRADGVIDRSNATLATWLGYEPASLTGRRFSTLLTLPGRIFYETHIATVMRMQPAAEEIALDLVTAAGSTTPMFVSIAELRGDDGRPRAVRIVLMRAHGRRSYERELLLRQAAASEGLTAEQETARLREQFIAVLGHDLRNPLASVAGAIRLLKREPHSEKASRVMDMVDASVERMAALIDDVMDFARGRLGQGISVEPRSEMLEPVLRHLVDELEASHPGRTIETEIDVPTPVEFDPGRIGQLVSNLLGNALAHGDPKSPVRLIARRSGQSLEIAIANAGPAMAPETMARLFQPFFRGEARRNHNGLGLGLHIAAEIARAHGGALSATSDDEETRFVFTMPIGQSGGQPSHQAGGGQGE